MVDLKQKPFCLKDEQERLVYETLSQMTDDEKIGQLFFPIGYSADPNYLRFAILNKRPGGLMFRMGDPEETAAAYNLVQAESKIPMFTAANLEAGGDGIADGGTSYGKQMQIAAAGDAHFAYELGKICAAEGKAVGCNFAFAPVVDIDLNWRNPITNVRTYGSDPETVIRCAREYIRACEEEKMLYSIKHFPGDGVDECDQHILTSVNSLSQEDWDRTYGTVYRTLIEDGARAVMAGHIALPAYQEKEKYLPASLSEELLTGLLRKKLGFNGLILTDATPMVGFCAAMERRLAVPKAIMAGCDMFLFNKDYDEDYAFMKEALENGLLTAERLDEAVIRILGTKVSMGLFERNLQVSKDGFGVIGCEAHQKMAKQCADRAVTLVKDTQQLLPIDPKKQRRVLLQILGNFASNDRVQATLTAELEKRGFTVIPYEKEVFDFTKPLPFDSVAQFREKYDLVLYVGNIENASNQTTNRISWYTLFGLGNNMPWFVKEVPTLFISLQNPYHLVDVPMIRTYINCYSNHDAMIRAAVEKICGESAFFGISPVDPFCGKEYLKNT
ncbi:MAG: glycoside hydrolase family 3 protein [Lachnospiraceae bacterium]|nr:glycoside hydrolase family 3 protein [Lachnospiraceae bacterium]